MDQIERNDQAEYSRRHREGVAKRLERIEALVEAFDGKLEDFDGKLEHLPAAIIAALAEQRQEHQEATPMTVRVNLAEMVGLAKQEEQHARQAFDQAAARIENLKRDFTSPFAIDRGRFIDDKAAIARELQVALTAKRLAEKELSAARRVRRQITGEAAHHRSPVVWLGR
jgi:hypothetical protein